MGIIYGDIRFRRGLEVNLPSFPEGQPGITTDTKRVFIGSDEGNVELAKQADIDNHAAQLAEKATYNISKDRFLSYAKTTAQRNPIYLIGDSITEGSATLDFTKDNWASVIRRGVQKHFNNRNYGFCNFNTYLQGSGVKTHHTFTRSGFSVHADCFEPLNFGGIRITSVAQGDYVDITYTGKDAVVVYVGDATYGTILEVKLDGVVVGSIDTKVVGSVARASFSTPITASSWGQHTIRLTNTQAKTAELCGMIYLEDSSQNTPVVYNVGRSSITAFEIPDSILDLYGGSGSVVLSLGVNDQLLSKSIPTFKAKIKRVCDNVVASKGSLIVCDFMFSLPQDNAYKVALREVVSQYKDFPFLDFAKLWFSDATTNKFVGYLDNDGVHPTPAGHEFIGNLILKEMGLPYTKSSLLGNESQFIDVTGFSNGWFSAPGYAPVGYMKNSNGEVILQGATKGGTTTFDTAIFALPSGYRPKYVKQFPIANNGNYGELFIKTDGTVSVYSLNNNAIVSLEGIRFFAS